MPRRKYSERSTRKIMKSGNSYAITIPIEIIKDFNWKEKQKVVVNKRGKSIIISDWKKPTAKQRKAK